MIRKLYGKTRETACSNNQIDPDSNITDSEKAKESFIERIQRREEFGSNYFSYLFYTVFLDYVCCCF